MSAQPRLVVSAPSSGHGKTAIAVGLLAACVARGIPAAGFKVGPDHTDAAYLGLAAGRPGRNLDPRLVGAQRVAPLFAHGAAGTKLSVIEGAMGLFDSLTGQPEVDGTAAVAATLRAPVVLVVDVAAMGHSLAALVHGFRMFDEMVHLGGVILNRVASSRHEQMLRTALDDIGMPVLGALRRGDLPNVLPARSHGPVPVAHRTVEASRAVRRLGEAVAAGLDLDRLMAMAGAAPALPAPIWTPGDAVGGEIFEQRPLVALAGGPGAPYTYVETAELLTAAGADIAVVDPLRDETLPAGTRALVVGAGLPEGYAEELSANRRLCNAVARFAHDGWPVVAEGVALPWLSRDFDGRPMCGVLDASAVTGEQTVAGYREATAPTTSPLAPAGARITGYKQHRAVMTPRSGSVPAWTWSGGTPEGFVWRQVHASQLGLHWAAAPEIAKRVVAAAIAGPPVQAPSQAPVLIGQIVQPGATTRDNGPSHGPRVLQGQIVFAADADPYDEEPGTGSRSVPVFSDFSGVQAERVAPQAEFAPREPSHEQYPAPDETMSRGPVMPGSPHESFPAPDETMSRGPVMPGSPHESFPAPDETMSRGPVMPGSPQESFPAPDETMSRGSVMPASPQGSFLAPDELMSRGPVMPGSPHESFPAPDETMPRGPVMPGSPQELYPAPDETSPRGPEARSFASRGDFGSRAHPSPMEEFVSRGEPGPRRPGVRDAPSSAAPDQFASQRDFIPHSPAPAHDDFGPRSELPLRGPAGQWPEDFGPRGVPGPKQDEFASRGDFGMRGAPGPGSAHDEFASRGDFGPRGSAGQDPGGEGFGSRGDFGPRGREGFGPDGSASGAHQRAYAQQGQPSPGQPAARGPVMPGREPGGQEPGGRERAAREPGGRERAAREPGDGPANLADTADIITS